MGKGSWKGYYPNPNKGWEKGGGPRRYIRNGVIGGREEQRDVVNADATPSAPASKSGEGKADDKRPDDDVKDKDGKRKKKKDKPDRKRDAEIEEKTGAMRKTAKTDTSFVADDSLAGTPAMLYPGYRVLHQSLILLVGSMNNGCCMATSIGARTNRIKLAGMSVLCGDLSTYIAYQSDYQQRQDLGFSQGFTNRLTYSFGASAVLGPIKTYLAVSNLNAFLLKLLGEVDCSIGKVFTLGLRNLSQEELPDPEPQVGDWEDPAEWADLFRFSRYYPEGLNDQA